MWGPVRWGLPKQAGPRFDLWCSQVRWASCFGNGPGLPGFPSRDLPGQGCCSHSGHSGCSVGVAPLMLCGSLTLPQGENWEISLWPGAHCRCCHQAGRSLGGLCAGVSPQRWPCPLLGRQGGVADLARGPRLACYGAKALLTPIIGYRKQPVSQLPCPSPGFALSLH